MFTLDVHISCKKLKVMVKVDLSWHVVLSNKSAPEWCSESLHWSTNWGGRKQTQILPRLEATDGNFWYFIFSFQFCFSVYRVWCYVHIIVLCFCWTVSDYNWFVLAISMPDFAFFFIVICLSSGEKMVLWKKHKIIFTFKTIFSKTTLLDLPVLLWLCM